MFSKIYSSSRATSEPTEPLSTSTPPRSPHQAFFAKVGDTFNVANLTARKGWSSFTVRLKREKKDHDTGARSRPFGSAAEDKSTGPGTSSLMDAADTVRKPFSALPGDGLDRLKTVTSERIVDSGPQPKGETASLQQSESRTLGKSTVARLPEASKQPASTTLPQAMGRDDLEEALASFDSVANADFTKALSILPDLAQTPTPVTEKRPEQQSTNPVTEHRTGLVEENALTKEIATAKKNDAFVSLGPKQTSEANATEASGRKQRRGVSKGTLGKLAAVFSGFRKKNLPGSLDADRTAAFAEKEHRQELSEAVIAKQRNDLPLTSEEKKKLKEFNGTLNEEEAMQQAIQLSLATDAYDVLRAAHQERWADSPSGTTAGSPLAAPTVPEGPRPSMSSDDEERYAKFLAEENEKQHKNDRALRTRLAEMKIEIVPTSGKKNNCLVNSILRQVLGQSVDQEKIDDLSDHYRARYEKAATDDLNSSQEKNVPQTKTHLGNDMITDDGHAIKDITKWINEDYGVNIRPAIVRSTENGDPYIRPIEGPEEATIIPILFAGSHNSGHYEALIRKREIGQAHAVEEKPELDLNAKNETALPKTPTGIHVNEVRPFEDD